MEVKSIGAVERVVGTGMRTVGLESHGTTGGEAAGGVVLDLAGFRGVIGGFVPEAGTSDKAAGAEARRLALDVAPLFAFTAFLSADGLGGDFAFLAVVVTGEAPEGVGSARAAFAGAGLAETV